MEVLAKLGIDPAIMLAQAVNFFVLLAILSFFVYKPLMQLLDERKARITTAEENAKKIDIKLAESEERISTELAKAQTKSKEIMTHAKKAAKETEEQLVADAVVKVEKIVADGREQIIKERDAAATAIAGEVAKIALLASEKLLGREVNAKDQEKYVADAMKEIGNLK